MEKLVKRCLHCGTSLSQLRATKRAGCTDCYNIFDEEISRMAGDVFSHGESGPQDRDEKIRLKDRLKQALFAEDYELAARLRDRLAGITGDEIPKEQ